ncbi:MAG: copper amine oxidase N-terminal domain-containing protein, partial [Armatimonadetes bacterium]|nr:copper amine oxidase N-terminal domain-containing protein [Armatimonadota bacterium]
PWSNAGVVMVQARPLAEWLGAHIELRGETVVVGSDLVRPRLVLELGKTEGRLEGRPYLLAAPPVLREGWVFVPLKAFLEAFEALVEVRGRVIRMAVAQMGLEAELAMPPAPGSLMAGAWEAAAAWFGLAQVPGTGDPWSLLSDRRQQKILAQVGPGAQEAIRKSFPARPAKGMRVLADGQGPQPDAAWLAAVVAYQDGGAAAAKLWLLRQRGQWRVDRIEEEPIQLHEPPAEQ